MSLTNEVFQTLVCSVDDEEEHIIEQPVLLPCGHNACRKCIDSKNGKPIECFFDKCNKVFRFDEAFQLSNNKTIEALTKNYLKDLYNIMHDRVKETFDNFDNLNYEKKIESNCETISKDINDRIEFLKRELDSMKAELQQQLQILKIKLIKLIPYNEIESMRNYSLRVKTSPPNLENLYGYQDKLKELKNNLSEFSKVNVYPFFFIGDTSIERPLVGNIVVSSYNCYLFKKRILSNNIRYLEVKFKPTRLCDAKSVLYLTHSEANKISVYSKEFEFIKAVDKVSNSPLNNPNGIASDYQKVYICDTGNNRILLCNQKLELVDIFGPSVLSNFDLNRPTDISLNNTFLFISDNLGSKIYKFTSDMIYIESFDVNKCPLHFSVLHNFFCVFDLETRASHFYDKTLFSNTRPNSSSNDDDNDENLSPRCESYNNEGPLCIIDNTFVQWNKFRKCFHFYDHEGKLDSNLFLKSLDKVEKSIKEDEQKKLSRSSVRSIRKPDTVLKKDLPTPRKLYKHEKVYLKKHKLKSLNKNLSRGGGGALFGQSFDKITPSNFTIGNSKRSSRIAFDEQSESSEFMDDICYFNGKILFSYDEKRIIIV